MSVAKTKSGMKEKTIVIALILEKKKKKENEKVCELFQFGS